MTSSLLWTMLDTLLTTPGEVLPLLEPAPEPTSDVEVPKVCTHHYTVYIYIEREREKLINTNMS